MTSKAATREEVDVANTAPAIFYDNVSVAYADDSGRDTTALDQVTLTIERGSFTTIIGPSGCGKTTLLRLCAGFQEATSGQTRCDGDVVSGLNSSVGYVTQQNNLYPWLTTRQNVEFALEARGVGKAERRRRSDEYLGRMGLLPFADHYPHQLSGGMQKRAAIAQTLIYEPPIILMDESFAGLDSQTRMSVEADLLKLWSDLRPTIVFVTHDLTEAIALSDAVVVMSQRPSHVKAVYQVPLPRPRDVYTVQADPKFAEAYGELWDLFNADSTGIVSGPRVTPGPTVGAPPISPVDAPADTDTSAAPRKHRGRKATSAWVMVARVFLLLAILGLWEVLSDAHILDDLVFSHPIGVFKQLVHLLGGQSVQGVTIWPQIDTTLKEMLFGFALGSVAGVLLGIILARIKFLGRVLEPFIVAAFGVPVIAIAPIVVLVLGIGFSSKVGTAAVTTFFAVFFQTFGGVASIDEEKFRLGRLMGASRVRLARRVLIKGSLPFIFQGLRMGVPLAMTGTVIGEFIASTEGLGSFILRTSSTFDAPDLYAALIVVLAIVVICSQILALVERRVLRWQPKK